MHLKQLSIRISLLFIVAMSFACTNQQSTLSNSSDLSSENSLVFEKIQLTRSIIILNDKVENPDQEANEIIRTFGGQIGHTYNYAIKGFSAQLPEEALNHLKANPKVRYISQDRIVTSNAQTLPTGINRINAEKNATAAINNDGGLVDVDIAVIDTGIDLDHPDLNVYRAVNFAKGPNTGDDGNGHGTHVAGTIGALDNDNQVVGVAPGARLWAIRALDNRGSGFYSDIIKGIDYVTQNANQIDVVNMSLGGPGSDDGNCGKSNQDALHEAICNSVKAGVVYVVAAGNENSDAANSVPSAYDEVITVSALADSDGLPGGLGLATQYGNDDTLASFSNYGPDVDIAAPGVNILSTWNDGGVNTISGTSMASPHIAGVVGLYIAKYGKPANEAGVINVKNEIIRLGYSQISAEGFTGDKDSSHEPLANAEAIDPSAPPQPAVKLSLTLDKTVYNKAQNDSVVNISAFVTNELGEPITALSSASFTTTLNTELIVLDFTESSNVNGRYDAQLDLATLNDGNYSLSVTTTDSRSLSDSALRTFEVTSIQIGQMHIAEISYLTQGGKNNNRNLLISIRVEDSLGQPVSSANLSISVNRDGSLFGTGSGTTNSSGEVQFENRNFPLGCYETTITSLTHSNFVWDQSADRQDPGYCK